MNEQKYQLLIKRHENAEMKHLDDSKVFKEYSNTIDDVNNNIDNYNPKREQKILIVFDDMIADVNTFKKFQSTVEEPFARCRKLNISLVFMTQSHFLVWKEVRLNSTHYLIIKIHDKRKLKYYY